MRVKSKRWLWITGVVCAFGMSGWVHAAPEASAVWSALRTQLFGERPIHEGGQDIVALDAPERAADAAIVPLTIQDRLAGRGTARWIKKLYLVIDDNPAPLAATFEFGKTAGRADIATRVRINAYTFVRAVAETDDGQLYMASKYIKASGGCSAPASSDARAAQAHVGEMRLQLRDPEAPLGRSHQVQLRIRHPNASGLQMNQLTRLYVPADFVKEVSVHYGDQLIWRAQTGISISENPSFRFFFVPHSAGELKAQVLDSKGGRYSSTIRVR